MVIYKYKLEITDSQVIQIPDGGVILSVADQDGALCLWAAVNPERPVVNRMIEVIGTGNPITSGRKRYIGTVVMTPFVWHVLESCSPENMTWEFYSE